MDSVFTGIQDCAMEGNCWRRKNKDTKSSKYHGINSSVLGVGIAQNITTDNKGEGGSANALTVIS